LNDQVITTPHVETGRLVYKFWW